MFPVVIIVGARQCGKSTLARMCGKDWKYYDLENYRDYERIDSDPILFFEENTEKVIIDEAQKSPKLFEILRGVVDGERKKKGRFILTGSASFELLKNVSESLAGRAAVVELDPFKINEFENVALSRFFSIFENKISKSNIAYLKKIPVRFKNNLLKKYFLVGGFPEPVLEKKKGFHANWMENYFDQYINRDLRTFYSKLDIIKYRRVVSMLSTLSGTIVNKAEIAKSAEIGERTVKDYMDIISGTFFWRSLEAFRTPKIKTTQKLPKGHFSDSGLELFLQNIQSKEELERCPYLGRYFESFVAEEIIRGIRATKAVNIQIYHLRTKAGGEIDLVVQGSFGLLPIEIKYGSSTTSRQLTFLKSFIELHNLPYGVVINNSDRVEMITDKIIQIPAGAI